MDELKKVYPGIDFDAPLPDITMYFDPDIDPAEIKAMKRHTRRDQQGGGAGGSSSSKPMTEQERKKQARKAALSKKKQEKMRRVGMMGTLDGEEEIGEEELARMAQRPQRLPV